MVDLLVGLHWFGRLSQAIALVGGLGVLAAGEVTDARDGALQNAQQSVPVGHQTGVTVDLSIETGDQLDAVAADVRHLQAVISERHQLRGGVHKGVNAAVIGKIVPVEAGSTLHQRSGPLQVLRAEAPVEGASNGVQVHRGQVDNLLFEARLHK